MIPVIGKSTGDRPRNGTVSDNKLLSVAEAAHLLRFSTRYVWQLVAAGSIQSIKHGRRRLISTQAIRDYLNALTDRAIFTSAEVAIMLDVEESEVRLLVDSGALASVGVGADAVMPGRGVLSCDERMIPIEAVHRLRNAAPKKTRKSRATTTAGAA